MTLLQCFLNHFNPLLFSFRLSLLLLKNCSKNFLCSSSFCKSTDLMEEPTVLNSWKLALNLTANTEDPRRDNYLNTKMSTAILPIYSTSFMCLGSTGYRFEKFQRRNFAHFFAYASHHHETWMYLYENNFKVFTQRFSFSKPTKNDTKASSISSPTFYLEESVEWIHQKSCNTCF